MIETSPTDRVPVLIAGGGPVGLTLALTLAQQGVQALLVERDPSTTTHPKMDITNGRSMELYRRLGIADELRKVAVPEENPFDVTELTSAAVDRGVPLTVVDVRDAPTRKLYERDLVLIRPDQHVAWRGDHSPADATTVIDKVRGAVGTAVRTS
jgi:2-polyprenyl-6-methoxyphenol hydroxylase-like FAD-dependent oxidoreductase